ncbi:MAG: alanine--tRNA ligase [Elusimicrobiota bacterium]|jgi:alanyl-tRNA synthetase|nr:alanine--tRNA ligase [Elusimicrobiota bacterium]
MNKQNISSTQIRKDFLNFFAKRSSTIVASDSLVPSGDKTLLFTSAGMVQFKQHFLGQSKDSFTRAASCQKCFRTSDIEQVGVTTRHLTFFEMLGNFSFGDYFKEDAIAWAWEFLTKDMALPIEKLYVTIYKDDDEAAEIWKKIVPASRITKMGDDTNFWNMGDTGPCGPCSEIYIDLGEDVGCKKSTCQVGCDCDRFLEIWNLVFTQFDRQADGSLKPLPRKNIDTGMGLERITAAACGKKSIFETDLFMPIISNACEILKIFPTPETMPKFRMIADHARAITFLIGDGILPSNEGRGYVLRRILRRALRQAKIFGYNEPFLNVLTKTVVDISKTAYPDLSAKLENIQTIVKAEEEKFLQTLESGSDILAEIIKSYKNKKTNIISGQDVFKLYDTCGFPQDLTKEIAAENGLKIDLAAFEKERKKAQEKSRAAWGGSGEKDISFYVSLHKKAGDTIFKGYENFKTPAKVLFLIDDNQNFVDSLKAGQSGELILSETSFYGESGGQVADKGEIISDNFVLDVSDVFKPIGNLFVHKIKVRQGQIKVGDIAKTIIDKNYRLAIARNHTATHLLQKALQDILGKHITQAGSLVLPNLLRFDFTHFSQISHETLVEIEKKVNEIIMDDLPVTIEQMDIDKARSLGAMALFGQKYGQSVRTVSVKENGEKNYSMELCGGTHVNRTGEIGFFKIISESSIGAGVRRIEALTGNAAQDFVLSDEADLKRLGQILDCPKSEILTKAQKQIDYIKSLETQLLQIKNEQVLQDIDNYIGKFQDAHGVKFLAIAVDNLDIKQMRSLSDKIKQREKLAVLLIVSKADGKTSFIVSASDAAVSKGISAAKIAKAFANDIKGSGGGKESFAQGGTKQDIDIKSVLTGAVKYLGD